MKTPINYLHTLLKRKLKFNTLENKYETLKALTKDECYKAIMQKLKNEDELESLKKENKKLREKIKEYRKKELENGKRNRSKRK